MTRQDQIAIWTQRRLHSKLHLPYFTADVKQVADGGIDYTASINTIAQRPLCGRQLNNHRGEHSQQADRLEFAQAVEEFTYQLLSGKACRHCAVKVGLLVKPERIVRGADGSDASDEENDL